MATIPIVTTLPTCDLSARDLATIEALLAEAFDGDFGAEDMDHALGGMHALAYVEGELVAHGAVVLRRLLHRGRAYRAGYVEAMAVREPMRRRGVGGAILAALHRVIRGGFALGALSATDDGASLYSAHGWKRWRGELFALGPHGAVATPDERGSTYVLPVTAALDLDASLTCDYRDGDAW